MFIIHAGIFQQQAEEWTPHALDIYVRLASGDYVRTPDGFGIWSGHDVALLVIGADEFLVIGADEFLVI